MLSAFTCYTNYHSTVDNKEGASKNVIFLKLDLNYLKTKKLQIVSH